MSQDKIEKKELKRVKFGKDVYEGAKEFNLQLATRGTSTLYALSKVGDSNVVTGAGGMVVGAIGFFGNRYYRLKGDDSAYTYMGQIVGGAQFIAGFLLLALEGAELYLQGDSSKLLTVVKMTTVALAVIEGTLMLVNSNLFSDTPPEHQLAEPRRRYD